MIDLEAVSAKALSAKGRAEQATDAQWCPAPYASEDENHPRIIANVGQFVVWAENSEHSADNKDAEFIAASRSDVPDLADAVLQLVQEVRRTRDALEPFATWFDPPYAIADDVRHACDVLDVPFRS